MNLAPKFDENHLQKKFQAIAADIEELAVSCQQDPRLLLCLLRELELTHRHIHKNFFQAALPNTRQDLYALLKDIEETGGWPYIERMRLKAFLEHLWELKNEETLEKPEDL